MSLNKYIRITVDGQQLDLYPIADTAVAINYKLEDAENFQTKTSSESLELKFPATIKNDKIFNTFHDPAVEDMSPDVSYRSIRKAVIEANGTEVLIGKSLLISASHNSCPVEYELDFYGNNGDWIIGLKDTTLYDLLKHINFLFSTDIITDSWNFDGADENLPYVFAPVRYGQSMNGIGGATYPQNLSDVVEDINCTPEYMKPSLSVYWIIYWGFKLIGYKINSDFFNTDYFRRMVMPWTWGSYLVTDGTRLDILKCLAKSVQQNGYWFRDNYDDFVDLDVSNDSTNGAYDNADTYQYIPANKEMRWTYPVDQDFGLLSTQFLCTVNYNATIRGASVSRAWVYWYKNGVEDESKRQLLYDISLGGYGRKDAADITDSFATFDVLPGDYISCKIYVRVTRNYFTGSSNCVISVTNFDYEYSRIPQGGIIDFQNYIAFQNYKFLDFLTGVIDFFNLMPQTDPIDKVVTIEPEYPYALENNLSDTQGGYFNGNWLDWNKKQDLSKNSTMQLFSDYERQLTFKFRDDPADGILKTIQDRYSAKLAIGTYVLPDRFKTNIKEIENRFFSPAMHYEVTQWRYITGLAPQMIVMAPENIANTSKSEAQNTFQPKLAWYKGIVDDVGGWKFNFADLDNFPFMFAVNYKAGGQNDPILSYADERIGDADTGFVIGKGLLKKFFWQRMAIMRNGQYYTTFFKLNNIDVTNWLHREHIICRGQRWQLQEINGYSPLRDETTECQLRKWVPVGKPDFDNTFPSQDNVLAGTISPTGYETKYYPLIGFATDIPQTDAPVDLLPGECVEFGESTFFGLTLPDASVGVAYNHVFYITGVGALTGGSADTKPSWMTVTLNPNYIVFSGTPDEEGSDQLVQLSVINACSDAGINTFINVLP